MAAVGVCIGWRIGHYADFRRTSDEGDPEDELGLLVVRLWLFERVDPGPPLGVLKTVLDLRGVCTIVGRRDEPT